MAIAVALISIMLALLLGYAISRSVTDPVLQMEQRFKSIAAGEFSQRLTVPNRDEVGILAEDLNKMTVELDQVYHALEDPSLHKSEFLATMSHEIRTLMNGVIGMIHFLLDGCDSKREIKPHFALQNIRAQFANVTCRSCDCEIQYVYIKIRSAAKCQLGSFWELCF